MISKFGATPNEHPQKQSSKLDDRGWLMRKEEKDWITDHGLQTPNEGINQRNMIDKHAPAVITYLKFKTDHPKRKLNSMMEH